MSDIQSMNNATKQIKILSSETLSGESIFYHNKLLDIYGHTNEYVKIVILGHICGYTNTYRRLDQR